MKRIGLFVITILLMNFSLPLQSQTQERKPVSQDVPGPEMEQAALQFVKTYYANQFEEFKSLKQTAPESYNMEIREILQMKEELDKLREEDPQRYELQTRQMILDDKAAALSWAYQTAKNERERRNVMQQLEAAIGKPAALWSGEPVQTFEAFELAGRG